MVTCANCGQENPAGFKFCGACGSPIAVEDTPPPEEERKVVTALFTDIVGSTARAENMDPEDVRAMLAPYYARLRKELESFGGTVEKFIGDAVVALFGAPIAHEDDAERAVRAALAIQDAVADLNAGDAWLDLHIRTAVNTGEALVVVGARAAEGEGIAAGDVMNTAARLQSKAPVDGIAVGEATFRATASTFEYVEAEPIEAKGKSEPVPVWVLVGEKEAPRRPTGRTPLVGRTEELAFLSGLWDRVRDERRPHLVTLVASPGIGKSRLLVALSDRAETHGSAHWGRCLPYGEGITYWPVREILKDAAGIRQSDDPPTVSAKLDALLAGLPSSNQDELRTIAAAVSNLLGVRTTPQGTYSAAEISQPELHWGIRRVLQLLALARPLLVVFEDLHWAEPTLLELIRYLEDADGEAPFLVVSSARPEVRDANPALLSRGDRRHVRELDPLTDDESAALLGELLGREHVPPGLPEGLLHSAAGNPLFLEETVRMLADAHALDGDGALDSMPVPDTLQALIGSRLDGLGGREKRVAQHASVVGQVFWSGAVSHLQGANGNLSGSLETLERRDFVHANAESGIAGDLEYAFKHILIRDVAYDRLPKGRRAELHVRFVDWLSGLPTAEDELVEIEAYHLEQACHLARQVARSPIPPPAAEAAEALGRAGDKAERRESIREADRYFARALELLGDDHPEIAARLRLRRAFTLNALGEVRQAIEEFVRLAEDHHVRPDVRCGALVALGNVDQRQGRASDARTRLAAAQALARELDDASLRIRANYALAALKADFEGEFDAAVEEVRRGVALAQEVGDRALRIEGHLRLGFFLINVARVAEAEAELRCCIALAKEEASLRDEARATYGLALVRYYRGDHEDAERLALQAREWLERTGESYFQIQNLLALTLFALASEDAGSAERWLREALPLALEGGGWLVIHIYRHLTDALVRQGRVGDARELAAFARRDVPAEDPFALAQVLLAEAYVAVGNGNAAEAIRSFAEALRLLEEQQLVIELAEARVEFARAQRRFGEGDEARGQLEAAREAFATMGSSLHLAQIDRELARLNEEGAGVAGPRSSSP